VPPAYSSAQAAQSIRSLPARTWPSLAAIRSQARPPQPHSHLNRENDVVIAPGRARLVLLPYTLPSHKFCARESILASQIEQLAKKQLSTKTETDTVWLPQQVPASLLKSIIENGIRCPDP